MSRLQIQTHTNMPPLNATGRGPGQSVARVATILGLPNEDGKGVAGPVLAWLETLPPATVRLGVVLGCAAFWALIAYFITQVL